MYFLSNRALRCASAMVERAVLPPSPWVHRCCPCPGATKKEIENKRLTAIVELLKCISSSDAGISSFVFSLRVRAHWMFLSWGAGAAPIAPPRNPQEIARIRNDATSSRIACHKNSGWSWSPLCNCTAATDRMPMLALRNLS